MLAIALGFVFAQVAASASPDNTPPVLLADTLPGLVPSPPGPTNGPINQSNVGLFGDKGGQLATLVRRLADGQVTGQLRFWRHQPPNGDGVVISAFQFTDRKALAAFLGGLDFGYGRVATRTFPVRGLLGASGYTAPVSASGNQATAFVVTFAKGSTAFEVQVITASGDLTPADAVAVATRQAANAPGGLLMPDAPTGTNTAYRIGEIVGAVVLGVLVVTLVVMMGRRSLRRRRRRKRRRVGTPTWHGVAPAPVPTGLPVPAREVGWHMDPDHLSEQAYWDGDSWTARRRWSGAAWVDVADGPYRDGGPPG
jgi:hypothetical protein